MRVPLAKFQKPGKDKELYQGVADSFIDPEKGVGWKVYTFDEEKLNKKIIYRKDLGEFLLEFFNFCDKNYVAHKQP